MHAEGRHENLSQKEKGEHKFGNGPLPYPYAIERLISVSFSY